MAKKKPPLKMKRDLKGPKSWSRLSLWDTCRLRYWFQYIEKVEAAMGLPALFGIAFHEYRFRYYDFLRVENLESDWDRARSIAKVVFKEYRLPRHIRGEFLTIADTFAQNRPLPAGMGMKHLFVAGIIAGLGLTVALFVATEAFSGVQQSEAKMGALLSAGCGILALIAGALLKVKDGGTKALEECTEPVVELEAEAVPVAEPAPDVSPQDESEPEREPVMT